MGLVFIIFVRCFSVVEDLQRRKVEELYTDKRISSVKKWHVNKVMGPK